MARLSTATKWYALIAGIVLLTVAIGGAYSMNSGTAEPAIAKPTAASEAASGMRTIQPVLVSGSSSFLVLGTVVSNETANIYPRRDGIVEDVYVDIGDKVYKNQVVALLLPKGVEGKSSALIGEKVSRVRQAEADVETTQQVAEETVISAKQKVKELETQLSVAKTEQEKILRQFTEAQTNVDQTLEQAFVSAQSLRLTTEMILLGSNARTRDFISEDQISEVLGQLEGNGLSSLRALEAFNRTLELETSYVQASQHNKSAAAKELLASSVNLADVMLLALQLTPTVPSTKSTDLYTYDKLSDRTQKISLSRDAQLKALEKIQDAENMFANLRASEPEVYSAWASGDAEGKKSNKVRQTEEQIRSAKNGVTLTEAGQEQMLEMKRQQVEIARSMLNIEYAESGHREIRSPFAGTVSKRFIEVGEIVMPSMPAFELTNVPTTLAKKAKTEIRFGLPERFMNALHTGDTIHFRLQSNEQTLLSAVVTRKSPQVDAESRTVTVQASVADATIPHGTSVRVELVDGSRPVFRLPSSAVKRDEEENYVLIERQDGTAEKLTVTVRSEDGEFAEVTGEIDENTAVFLLQPIEALTESDNSHAQP